MSPIDTAGDPARALQAFRDSAAAEATGPAQALTSWLFTDRKLGRGELAGMHFYDFVGPEHLKHFFRYIRNFKYPDFLDPAAVAALAERSVAVDRRVLEGLGVSIDEDTLANIGRYNAQDYLFQRAYAVPDRLQPRRVLDFGAGHGRLANLAFSAPDSKVEVYCAIDGIPASYLTQNMYYSALGLRVYDYLDHVDASVDVAALESEFDAFHFPTWRLADLPDCYFDMVCAVQVLREVSIDVLLFVVPHLARVLKPGGALYVRDHVSMHNPNGMPQDELLAGHGLSLEYYPRVRDGFDVHGVPRIWRKFDPSRYEPVVK